tara:strand:+ start:352 stop:693 length:342 start_codon:yes stop_codon:yes gene_type:complete
MPKKLNSFEDLAKIKFNTLAPDPDPLLDLKPELKLQKLEAHFSNKGRSGKIVTIIKGFEGELVEIKALAKKLKNTIGVGGSVKNREIIIQGNYRNKIIKILNEMGHAVNRIGG